jgi:hypothetical protein
MLAAGASASGAASTVHTVCLSVHGARSPVGYGRAEREAGNLEGRRACLGVANSGERNAGRAPKRKKEE